MSCAKCERPFRYGTEDTVTINRKTYHSDCLSCDQCSKPYDGSFLPDDLDREALCRECTRKQKPKSAAATRPKSSEPAETKAPANRCGGCGLPFNPASRHITKRYKNREYHHNCLKCHQCQALIEGEIYEDEQGNQIFCTSCFKSHDQKSFQRQNQEKKRNQQKSVHFAEKLAETLNRDELAAFYKNESGRNHDEFMMGNEQTGEIAFCAACMLPFHNGSRITQANDRDYHYECFTCEKCSQPINGVFTMNAEGSRFQCGKCLQKSSSSSSSAGSSLRLCVECNRPIDPQQHGRIEMNHRFYHSDCFVCAICRRRLNPSQTYSIFNDQPWCRQCEDKTKSCYNCRKPVIDTGITYETRDYHVECFRCSQCGKSLEHEEILCANDLKPFCSPCHDDLFAKRCAKCRRPIPSNTKYPVVDEKPYHDQCFLCTKCHRPIGSKKFFKDQRGFICSNCG